MSKPTPENLREERARSSNRNMRPNKASGRFSESGETEKTLGICYYPEQWPEVQWVDDARRMADLGLTYVRIGEFAWSRLEPDDGVYAFDWLERAIDTLAEAGLKIVLGTPTATPPKWLVDKMPSMLAIDANGNTRKFGSRRHYCFAHKGYRRECARIVRVLAERFGEHPALAVWQTDNEYGCHDTILSYSGAARDGFRDWLEQRYTTIGALNAAWGTVFWSMEYRSFDEIDLPDQTVTEAHPAHRLDHWRFMSDQVAGFDREQVAIIRELSPGRRILHNFMGRFTDFDHYKVAETHDAATWDSYPLGFLSERSARAPDHALAFARQGDPDFQAFHHDLYRSVGRGRLWVMEQQPGPVNWAPWNPAPLDGMVRLWSLEAFAHGAETVSYFRWRQAPFAQEQMHTGLLRPDSSADTGFEETARVAADMKLLDQTRNSAPVGLIFDYQSAWAWTIQPQGADFSYFELVFETYCALRRAGLSVDFLPSQSADWSKYRMVLAPGIFSWTPEMRVAMAAFEGIALIGPRSGSRTGSFQIPVGMPPDLPPDVLDARIVRTQSLPPRLTVSSGNATGIFDKWFETLETGPNADAELVTPEGPGMVRQANIRYLAGWPDAALFDTIIAGLADEAGLSTMALPNGLRCRDHGGQRLWFNYSAEPVDIRQYCTGEISLDGPCLPPAGVAIERL